MKDGKNAMQKSKLVREGKLEEYKTLRAEVLGIAARSSHQLTIAWAGTFGLLSAGWASGRSELAMLSVIFISVVWRESLRLSTAAYRIGEYIAVAIEPSVPGLEWEGKILEFHRVHVASRNAWSRLKRGILSSYGALGLISLTVSLFQMMYYFPSQHSRRVISLFLVLLAVLSLLAAFIAAMKLPLKRGRAISYFSPTIVK